MFLKGSEFSHLVKLAWPVMLSQLGHVSVGVADSIMIGQTGTMPLAASAFANSVFVLVLVFGIGVSYGLTPLVAKSDGEQNHSAIQNYFRHGLVVNTVFGLALFALLLALWFALPFMKQNSEVLRLASPYFLILSAGILPFMIFMTFKQFAEGMSDTKTAMAITLSANLLNIFLNYLLIYGKFGFPAMGLMGAGYATLASRVAMVVAMYLYIINRKRFAPYRIRNPFQNLNLNTMKRILQIGIPSGLQYIFEVGAFALAAVIIGSLGPIPLAAHQVAISLASISYMAASGIAAAVTVRVGQELGRRNSKGVQQVGKAGFLMAGIWMLFSGLVFVLARNWFPQLYTSDPDVIALSAHLLVIAVFFQISDGLQVVGLGALRGISDVKMPTILAFTAYWVITLPLAWWWGIELKGGVVGIWWSLAIGLTLAAAAFVWRFMAKTQQRLPTA